MKQITPRDFLPITEFDPQRVVLDSGAFRSHKRVCPLFLRPYRVYLGLLNLRITVYYSNIRHLLGDSKLCTRKNRNVSRIQKEQGWFRHEVAKAFLLLAAKEREEVQNQNHKRHIPDILATRGRCCFKSCSGIIRTGCTCGKRFLPECDSEMRDARMMESA